MNLLIPEEIIKELILNGVRFKYISYDYKKASEEFHIQNQGNNYYGYAYANGLLKISHYDIPETIRNMFLIWRIGKVWEIRFNKNGGICSLYVGVNPKFKKRFFISEIGRWLKPMIFKSDDKHDLIARGLAIEETI